MSLYNNCLEISFWGGQSTRPIMLGIAPELIPDPLEVQLQLDQIRMHSADGSGIRNNERIMEIEKYTITYKIGNDIPINPAWIREQLQAAVAKLQAEIDKKNTHGQHVLEFK